MLALHIMVAPVPNGNLICVPGCRVGAVARNPLGAGALSGSYDGVLRVWNGAAPSYADAQGYKCLVIFNIMYAFLSYTA
jgi:hypothetical protein